MRSLERVRELPGCAIVATDGACGRVHDAYLDDRCWIVRYLAVATGDGSGGPRVLLPLARLERIWWRRRRVEVALPRGLLGLMEQRVHVDLRRDPIHQAPAYDPARPVDRAYEASLRAHYDRPPLAA
jgi:hypothetical protein